MSDEQIKQILLRLDKQDADAEAYRKEREKIETERVQANYELARFLKDENKKVNQQMDDIQKQIRPIVDLANSVKGFDRISIWILKFILGAAAVLSALGTIIYFIRKLLIPPQ
jgi:hypothetical protein